MILLAVKGLTIEDTCAHLARHGDGTRARRDHNARLLRDAVSVEGWEACGDLRYSRMSARGTANWPGPNASTPSCAFCSRAGKMSNIGQVRPTAVRSLFLRRPFPAARFSCRFATTFPAVERRAFLDEPARTRRAEASERFELFALGGVVRDEKVLDLFEHCRVQTLERADVLVRARVDGDGDETVVAHCLAVLFSLFRLDDADHGLSTRQPATAAPSIIRSTRAGPRHHPRRGPSRIERKDCAAGSTPDELEHPAQLSSRTFYAPFGVSISHLNLPLRKNGLMSLSG